MNGTKEADLVTAVLLYATRCLAEGDQHALRSMNFGPEEIDALQELNMEDIYRAGSLQSHCLYIRLNRQVYWPLMTHLRRQREVEQLERDLVRIDAPFEMMQSLFRLSPRDYTRLRRLLVVDASVGRPPVPDEGASHDLWHAWQKLTDHDASTPLKPEEYLALHEQTDAPMRAIWDLTQRWSTYGNLVDTESEDESTDDALC